MTATLTDHHGAIAPAVFNADHPDRPSAGTLDVNALAERRVWGSSTRVPGHPRRVAAVGHTQHWGQHTILCVDSVEDGTVYAETVHVR